MLGLGLWQARLRSPLTWQEADRVDAGAAFNAALSSAHPSRVWDWITAQHQPILAPVLHGLAFVFTDDPVRAAWVPSALAFALCGLLSAALARRLGAGKLGAWVAAVLVWTTPLTARLAGGAFTEGIGASLLVGLVILVQRARTSFASAIGTGLVLAAAWWCSYDYGVLAMAILFAATAGDALARAGPLRLAHNALAAGLASVAVGAQLLVTSSSPDAVRYLSAFFRRSGTVGGAHLFYVRTLFKPSDFSHTELGIASAVGAILVLGLAWTLANWSRRREWHVPALAVGVWLVLFTAAASQEARFIAVVLPVLASMTGAAITDLVRHPEQRARGLLIGTVVLAGVLLVVPDKNLGVRLIPVVAALGLLAYGLPRSTGGRVSHGMLVGAVAAAVAVQVGPQLAGMRDQLWLVKPNPPASQALVFLATADRPATGRPVVLLGASSALSPALLQLMWHLEPGGASTSVVTVADAARTRRDDQLVETITRHRPAYVITVRTGSGSRLSPSTDGAGDGVAASQREYAHLGPILARRGLLKLSSSFSLDSDPVRIDIWTVVPGGEPALRGAETEARP